MKRNLFMLWLMRALLASVSAGVWASAGSATESLAQSSSLFRRADANMAPLTVRPVNMDAQPQSGEPGVSYFTVRRLPKKVYKVGDLVTVIVRNKSEYKNDGKTDLKRDTNMDATLKDWIRFHDGKLIPASQPGGDPTINFDIAGALKADAKFNRTNEFITRITCQVLDVLPNGNLVLQGGTDEITTDGEKQSMTLTGSCRSEDILPDNTIISTQIYQLKVINNNSGAVKDAMKRGWMQKIWDTIKPL